MAFGTESKRENHIKWSAKFNRMFNCDQCNYSTCTRNGMYRHYKKIHEILVDSKFLNNLPLTPNLNRNENTKINYMEEDKYKNLNQIKCDQCSLRFGTNILLEKHQISRTKFNRLFNCTICTFTSCTERGMFHHYRRKHK